MKKTLTIAGIAIGTLIAATLLYIGFYQILSEFGLMYQGVSITEWTRNYIQQHPVAYAIEFAGGVVLSFVGAESLYRDWEESK